MSNTEQKLKNLAAKNPTSNWKEKVAFRKENKAWLKKSTRVALRILDALDDKDWSQADLARELGVTRQQVSKLVKGQSDFKFSTVSQLEKVLDIQLQAILAEGEVVMSEEMIEERVNQGVTDYHRKLLLTQQYFELKNQKSNPFTVMAVEPNSEDEYALAG
ncbi:helix-turn-helix protein [Algoriphagus ratkowskyi]|uniref:Helix-turn-helix protein n=1 Tax=Algoriphagus ratkowskyi TaxID=57028 RepID=A0A2W7R9B1_9BACT|nr:helix-turn-helix transcriptional regulator [Algoriphagus ratkowskyi]PZX57024.1 helix-turn-helix protein [Algoriphagus ratkowskyi]TXD79927.1 helix-turn-helix transcriptional regulator [Algoriphagus ratkowskyi]